MIEEASEAADGTTERASSHLYVKSFIGKDGRKRYFFKSVTVKRDGLEVNVSSHFDRPKRLREALKKGKLLYRFDGGAQTEQTPASVSVTTSRTNPGVSFGKGKGNSSTSQEQTEKVVKDKTPNANSTQAALAAAEQETNTEPTKAQKGAAVSTGHVKGKTDGKGKTKPLRSSLMASSRCGRS